MNLKVRRCIFFLLLVFPLMGKGQNATYSIIYDSIYPLYSTNDYAKAKSIWNNYLLSYETDPSERLMFMGFALRNNDVDFYRENIVDVIEKYGWNYTYFDTLPSQIERSLLLQQIIEHHLVDWTIEQSKKYYPIWVKNHPDAAYFQNQINAISSMDQAIRRNLPPDEGDSVRKLYNEQLIKSVDDENLHKIIELAKLNNDIFPNNFDHGPAVFSKISMVVWHSLKDPETMQAVWDLILPYVEKSFKAGKISRSLFLTYDKWSYHYHGHQYYGTLGNGIPIKDEDTFLERKKRFKLD